MPRIWLIHANIWQFLPKWWSLFTFSDTPLVSASWPRHLWNTDRHLGVPCFCFRCGLAPRQIIREELLAFLSCAQGVCLFPELWRPIAFCKILAASFCNFTLRCFNRDCFVDTLWPYGDDFRWGCWQSWLKIRAGQPWPVLVSAGVAPTDTIWQPYSPCVSLETTFTG